MKGPAVAFIALVLACSSNKEEDKAPPPTSQEAPTTTKGAKNKVVKKNGDDKPKPAPGSGPSVSERLIELGEAAACSDENSPQRAWCHLATGWESGSAPELSEDKAYWVGIAVELGPDSSVKDALDAPTLAQLVARREGDHIVASIKRITPDNETEEKVLKATVAKASKDLQGKSAQVTLPSILRGFLEKNVDRRTVHSLDGHLVTATKKGWYWKSQATTASAEIRALEDGTLVATEVIDDGTVALSVFALPKAKTAPN